MRIWNSFFSPDTLQVSGMRLSDRFWTVTDVAPSLVTEVLANILHKQYTKLRPLAEIGKLDF